MYMPMNACMIRVCTYVYNIKFIYTAHSALPQSSNKSSKRYVIVIL